MADSKKEKQVHPFDEMMFGNRRSYSKKEEEHEASESESVDLFDSVGIVREIYQQLSPVVKDLNKARKNFSLKK
ncbi:hypothetical protein RZN25_01360 [Bacillaceae bacterium S4-13-56]